MGGPHSCKPSCRRAVCSPPQGAWTAHRCHLLGTESYYTWHCAQEPTARARWDVPGEKCQVRSARWDAPRSSPITRPAAGTWGSWVGLELGGGSPGCKRDCILQR